MTDGIPQTDDAASTPTPQQMECREKSAAGLRSLANMMDTAPPLVVDGMRYALRNILVPVDGRADMAAFARAGKAAGATIAKAVSDKYAAVDLLFADHVRVHVYADREEVCDRVVTGTEVVTKMVPDPTVDVPLVAVDETVETVEWVCRPLLDGEGES